MNTQTFLFCGGYTHRSPVGIRVFDADPDGTLRELSSVDHVEHPSFLATHPGGRIVYAVSETTEFDGRPGGGIVAFAFDPTTGALSEIDRVSSLGDAPCHLSVATDGSQLYVANYLGGSIASYALRADGRFGEVIAHRRHEGSGPTDRQRGPHAHCVRPSPDGAFVHAADLGTDTVYRYAVGADTLEPAGRLTAAPGAGPRQVTFHPTRPLAFVINELDCTLTACATDEGEELVPIQTLPTLAEDHRDSIAADVQVHPDGHRLYASTRGADTVAVYACEPTDQPLRLLGHVPSGGATPRSMTVHPAGRTLLVANQDSDTIVPFALADGYLPSAGSAVAAPAAPTCLITLEVAR